MFKILIADKLGQAGIDRLGELDGVTYDFKPGLSKEELIAIMPEYDAMIVRSAVTVDADIINAAPKLKVIGRAGVGVDNIDTKHASQRGIIVMNTPDANTIATAEHSMTLILAACRYTGQAYHSMKKGEWNRSEFVGQQLYRKTIGLIGFGRIARQVAKRCKAFEMDIIAYDPYVSQEIADQFDAKLMDLKDVLAQADIISLHTALSDETREMINEKNIALMKNTAIVVNPSRGGLVNEKDIADALTQNKLAHFATDVFSSEPPAPDNPLLNHDKILHTPHLGASTKEAQSDVAIKIVEQIVDALHQRDFRNSVNMPFEAGPNFDKALPLMSLAEKIGILHFNMADAPIREVEVQIEGDDFKVFSTQIGTGLLKGIIQNMSPDSVNFVNAASIAQEQGIAMSQTTKVSTLNYANAMLCKVKWEGGERVIVGAMFGQHQPRVTQISDYHMDFNPSGIVMLMLNHDQPGVIGTVGTLLAQHNVNIGEWRLGRAQVGDDALAVINLDSMPDKDTISALQAVPAVQKIKVVDLG